jgi:hypothetical protein
MTSRDTPPLRGLLLRLYRRHQSALALRFGLRAAAAVAAAIAVAVLLGAALSGGVTAAWVRLVLLALAAAAAVAAAVRRFSGRSLVFDAFLEQVERRFPAVRSWLRNSLDLEARPPAHASAELASALTAETARRAGALPLATLTPPVEPRRPLATLAGAALALALAGAVFPGPTTRSWRTLWNPALAAPPVRLVVEPGSVKITPGAALTVRVRVWGTVRPPQLERPGEPRAAAVAEGSGEAGERLWRFDLAQLTREQEYRVRAGHVLSPAYRITLAGEPAPVSFEIEYRAPSYAGLPVQRGSATRGDLTALRGTRARVVATFDRDLESVAARVGGAAAAGWTQVTPRRWSGEIVLDRPGEYELHAVAAAGEARMRYRLNPLADAPPVIAVQTPASDLDLPAGQTIPVEVLAQDDLGLARLRLQYRRDPESLWESLPLARYAPDQREVATRTVWDASPLGLLPGQTATFRFEVEDNNAFGPGRTVSPTFELRFPGLAELYESLDRSQGQVHQSLEKAAEQARDLQKTLDKLARQPAQPTARSAPAFERSSEMKSALERQQELAERIDQAAGQLQETLEKAAEREAFGQELTDKLREMGELMKQIQSEEFREALRRMQQALERMDQESLEQTLPQWREQNRDMLEQLRRTIELLKQLRDEERLDALARRAEDLKREQDALNREHAGESPEGEPRDAAESGEAEQLARDQEAAARKSEELAQEAKELAESMQGTEEEQPLEQAGEELAQDAAGAQREASRSAAGRQRARAMQAGQKASESLDSAAKRLQEASRQAQSRRQGADLAAIRRAAQDLVSLQRETERNLASGAPHDERGDRQTDLSEGVSRVADSLQVLARQQPFISPRLGEALGRAIQSLSASGRELSSGNRSRGEESGRSGGSALNQAVLELRATESRMCQSPGAAGGTQQGGSRGEQMGDLGERQSQLNRETRDVAKRLTEQMRLQAGDAAQMRALADRQRQIREQLEQIQRDEEIKRELLGRLDAAQRDMQKVEEVLERGELPGGELEQAQQRILSRLLDAQRSMNRRDYDPERESRPGEVTARTSAPELPQELLRPGDRLRLDLLKADADRYPAQYRAFVEAYLRSLNEARSGAAR